MDSRHPTYVKTPKGIEEVERKAHGLPLKARQVLIMLDGKRDLAALQQMFPPDSVPGVLAELLAGGFARELEAPRQPAANGDDEDPFVLAQTYMVNIARKILGIAGKEVIARLQAATDLEALRALYPEWRAALRQSPDGVMRMKEFDYKLSQVLGDLSAQPAAARGAAPAAGESAAAPAAPRAGSAPANDGERLVMARNFMIGSLRSFLGIAANQLIARVETARTIAELRQMFFDWREALKQSPDAKRRLVELEAKLAALLS